MGFAFDEFLLLTNTILLLNPTILYVIDQLPLTRF